MPTFLLHSEQPSENELLENGLAYLIRFQLARKMTSLSPFCKSCFKGIHPRQTCHVRTNFVIIDKKRPAVLGYSLHSVMAVFYAVRKMLFGGGVEVERILKVMDIAPSSGSTAQLRRDNV
jgi:hypothetical protein